jgi:hypothetical protein
MSYKEVVYLSHLSDAKNTLPLGGMSTIFAGMPAACYNNAARGQIDRLVYELYGPTEEKIGIVEGTAR